MFKKQYFSIIIWKSLVYLLGVFSLLIVTPALTSKPKIFGIYSFCVSLLVFFSYADLGFISSCRKFAAEYVAKRKLKAEIAVTGFSCLIFLLIGLPLSGVILFFSFHPDIIITDLSSSYERAVSFYLLLILAISFPILIVQRMVQIIYAVRLKDAIVYRLEIVSIAIRIISALYFFRNGQYEIVEFFMFSNLINFANVVILCVIAHFKFKYDFIFFIKSLRFRKTIYKKISRLAFASLFTSIAWLLYYEIDIVLITSISGALAAAYYAVAFNLINILRNLLGSFYYPLVVKFNYLVVEDVGKMKAFIYKLLKLGNYLIFPGLCVLVFFSKQLVVSWLGVDYLDAVVILQLLFASYLFYPTNTLLGSAQTAMLNVKLLYVVSSAQLLIQYLGLLFLSRSFDVSISLACLKIGGSLITCIILFRWAAAYFGLSIKYMIKNIFFLPICLSLVISLLATPLLNHIPLEKGIIKLAGFAGAIMLLYVIILISLLFLDKVFRNQIREIRN